MKYRRELLGRPGVRNNGAKQVGRTAHAADDCYGRKFMAKAVLEEQNLVVCKAMHLPGAPSLEVALELVVVENIFKPATFGNLRKLQHGEGNWANSVLQPCSCRTIRCRDESIEPTLGPMVDR